VRAWLAGLVGSNRPKVIAVFGATRAEVECAIRHAQTSAADLPVWAWCAEEIAADDEPVEGCARLISGSAASTFSRDLREVWPALSIVGWTGRRGSPAMKLLPLATPPFRVVLFNEAEGFFAPSPPMVVNHVKRRFRDASCDWVNGAIQWMSSLALRTGERTMDWFNLFRSFFWRSLERVSDCFNWTWESLLAVLAFFAQWTAPLSYEAVRRTRNGRPRSGRPDKPAAYIQEAAADTFVEVTIPNRGWPRRAILQAASQSGAGFIVLRMRGELANAAPLIAIALETDAFAVAKQSAYAAWRKQVVNKHPFRRLQEGEVSEVFAPFSSLIVIRRKTLLSLGIPAALTYGGALMLLFWKSTAAGLRSVVAGHRSPVMDESAMALEDAELALRLTVSPSLAALGPLRPHRFRGNVAWSPFHRREGLVEADAIQGKGTRVLVVSPYLPFPLSHGGAVRIYNLCLSLSGQIDFVLACFREANETVCYEELHKVFREVYVVDADERHADLSVPKQAAEYRNGAMSDLIRTLCLDHRVDIVQLEYTQLAEYRDDTGGVPVILVEHDITFTLYSQLADFMREPQVRRDYERWLEFERAALQCSNTVWTMSHDERSVAIEHGAPRECTRVIPNGVDLRRFMPTPRPAGPPVVLFIGSFRHLPNLLAFESLRTSIMPAVWQQCPDAVLHVVAGLHHERAAELAGKAALLAPHPQIVIEGFVADVRPAYSSADVAAIPLPLSAGTNIKVLEAMACGRAIVSTPEGCRGLGLVDGRELIVAELGSDFAGALISLLRNADLRARIAEAARRTAELRFGWDEIAQDALDVYAGLTPRSPTQSPILAKSVMKAKPVRARLHA
jgi:glycosyltransferase involved in cell wall biosynthesis